FSGSTWCHVGKTLRVPQTIREAQTRQYALDNTTVGQHESRSMIATSAPTRLETSTRPTDETARYGDQTHVQPRLCGWVQAAENLPGAVGAHPATPRPSRARDRTARHQSARQSPFWAARQAQGGHSDTALAARAIYSGDGVL